MRLHANEAALARQRRRDGGRPEPLPRAAAARARCAPRRALRSARTACVLAGARQRRGHRPARRGSICAPARMRCSVTPPTFGMYAVAARIQGARRDRGAAARARRTSRLDSDGASRRARDRAVKIVFLCSPNNPTGNLLERRRPARRSPTRARRQGAARPRRGLRRIRRIDPRSPRRRRSRLRSSILRTLSKAHALAGARCGALIAAARDRRAARQA